MLVKPALWRRACRGLALRVFSYLENNNDVDISTNGEARFIKELLDYYRRKNGPYPLVVFDIGANEGQYTGALLKAGVAAGSRLEIHAFEPVKNTFSMLVDKFAAISNVTLNNQAASDHTGPARIFVDPEANSLASMQRRELESYRPNEETIETIRLDAYVSQKRLRHIHLVKLDVEGHEYAVLKGFGGHLDPHFIDFCQFEYGGTSLSARVTLQDLYRLFEENGFVIGKLMRHGVELRPYWAWMDNFHYSNYIAISARIVETLS